MLLPLLFFFCCCCCCSFLAVLFLTVVTDRSKTQGVGASPSKRPREPSNMLWFVGAYRQALLLATCSECTVRRIANGLACLNDTRKSKQLAGWFVSGAMLPVCGQKMLYPALTVRKKMGSRRQELQAARSRMTYREDQCIGDVA